MCCVARAEHLTRRPRAPFPWRSASPVVLYTAARCRGLFRLAASGLRLGVSPGPSLGALPGTRRFPWPRRPGSACASAGFLPVRLGALRVLLGRRVLGRFLACGVLRACGRPAVLSRSACVSWAAFSPVVSFSPVGGPPFRSPASRPRGASPSFFRSRCSVSRGSSRLGCVFLSWYHRRSSLWELRWGRIPCFYEAALEVRYG